MRCTDILIIKMVMNQVSFAEIFLIGFSFLNKCALSLVLPHRHTSHAGVRH